MEQTTLHEVVEHIRSDRPISSFGKRLPVGMEIIEDIREGNENVNCFGYVFGGLWIRPVSVEGLLQLYEKNEAPRESDVVLYVGYKGSIQHAGIFAGIGENRQRYIEEVVSNPGLNVYWGRVRSKWGKGPVFEHDILQVPYEWESIEFFRKKY